LTGYPDYSRSGCSGNPLAGLADISDASRLVRAMLRWTIEYGVDEINGEIVGRTN